MKKTELRILLVDDNENDYIITRELLADIEEQAPRLEWVSTYRDGLEAISRRQHDVYLIDYRLGPHSGLELLREAVKRGCTAPLILLTGQGDHRIDLQAMQSGAADYLVKDQLDPLLLERSMRYALEQKRTQEALRASEERFRELVENIQVGVLLLGAQGEVLLYNQAVPEFFGSSLKLLSQAPLMTDDIICEDGTPFPKEEHPITIALKTGQAVHNVVMGIKRRAGDRAWLLVNADPQLEQNGKVRQIICSFNDITARKIAEEQRHHNKQLRVAAEVSAQINTILEPDRLLSTTVSLLQKGFNFYHVHAYLLDEQHSSLVMQVGSGDVGRTLRSHGHAIPIEHERSIVAHVARSKKAILVNDTRSYANFLSNPLLPNTHSELAVPLLVGGRLLGVLDIQEDEANRFVQADVDVFNTLAGQIAIALDNAGLFEEVNRTAAQLRETAERLREMDRLKSEFLANMSHELRTPLNSIIGYSEIMLMGINGPLNDETKEDVEAILSSGQHLLSLINDILDLAKIEAGQMTLQIEEINLQRLFNEIQKETAALLRQQNGQNGIKKEKLNLVVELIGNPVIEGDRLRVKQILTNLLSNAIKFTDRGTIRLKASDDHGPPWGRDEGVALAVEDQGIGISHEHLSTIFEQFRQVDGTSTRTAEGTGLGLAITAHLVRMHGGAISVKSKLKEGSTFTVRLPIKHPYAKEEG